MQLEAENGDDPAGRRRSEIGTEDDAQRLREGHKPGTNEADHGDGGGARRLDYGSRRRASHSAAERRAREPR